MSLQGRKLLSPQKRAFIRAFKAEANGDPTEAARLAGYKKNHTRIGARLVAELASYISSPEKMLLEARKVLQPDDILEELSKIAKSPTSRDRIKAMEVLLQYHGTLLGTKIVGNKSSLQADIDQLLTEIQQAAQSPN